MYYLQGLAIVTLSRWRQKSNGHNNSTYYMEVEMYSLVGVDGNAYSLMGYTANAMKRHGFTKDEIDQMYKEATAGYYNNLICVCDGYISKVNERLGDEEDD